MSQWLRAIRVTVSQQAQQHAVYCRGHDNRGFEKAGSSQHAASRSCGFSFQVVSAVELHKRSSIVPCNK